MTNPPLGRVTRGKTASGRLAILDTYLLRYERPLLSSDGLFVDLGFGEHPLTTLESAAAFRAITPNLHVVGVDISPHRVAAAQPHATPHTRFIEGGFELGDLERPATLIRAMNVLRQYRPAAVPDAHQSLGQRLTQGGLLLEGTSDKHGQCLAAHLLRRRNDGLEREALLMATDFSRGFAPLMFRDVLPRDLRRRVTPGEPIHDLFMAWTAAWQEARRAAPGPAEAFHRSALVLAERVPGVATDVWLLERGVLRWSPAGGVPQAGRGG